MYFNHLACDATNRPKHLDDGPCCNYADLKMQDVTVRIDSEGRVTLPASVMAAMDVGPGDHLEVVERPDGFLVRRRKIDYARLGLLKDLIPPDHPPFDIRRFREDTYVPELRD